MATTHSLDLESGSSQYASISNASAPNLDISGAQTWEAWIKPESLAANMAPFGSLDAAAAIGIQLYIGTSGQMILNLRGVTITSATTANGFITNGVWQHIGFKWNGTNEVTIWSNDQTHTSATSGSLTAHANAFAIGRPGDYNGNYFDGLIRNARVWNVARTQQEIRENMNVDTPVGTGLQGNWILNNAYTDSSGNGYTLTASGSPTFSTTYPDAIDLVENTGWTANKKLTLNVSSLSLSGDLTDVPVPLTESIFSTGVKNAVFAAAKSDGSDVRFSTDIDGKIRLAHELVSWDNSGKTMEIHLKLNSLDVDADNTIYMHYGNSGASALDENEAFGKHQVYPSAWKAVYHMQDGVDSTSNSNDGTATNVTFATANGKLQKGGLFNGSSSKVAITNNASLRPTTAFWVSAWVKMTSSANGLIFESYQQNGAPAGWQLFANAGKLGFLTGDNSGLTQGSDYQLVVDTDTFNDGNWHRVTGYWSGTQLRIFLDGAEAATAVSWSTAPVYHANNAIRLGVNEYITGTTSNDWLDGSIDQATFYLGTLNTDLEKALYNLQNDPAGFIEVESSFTPFFFFLT